MTVRPYQADVILLLVAASWGCTFVLVQDAIEDVPVFGFLFFRFLVSFLIMVIFSYKYLSQINRPILLAGIVLGALNFSLYAFQTYGLAYTTASIVAFITGLNVIFVPFIARVFFNKRVSVYAVIGAIVAVSGLWMLTSSGSFGFGIGEVLTLVCAILIAFHLLFTDIYVKKYSVILLVTIQFGVVAVLSGATGVLIDGNVMPASYSSEVGWALAMTILFATVFAFWAQASMQRFTTPTRTAVIFSMEPVSAAIFNYFYIGEVMLPLQILGGLIMVAGVIVSELGSIRTPDYN